MTPRRTAGIAIGASLIGGTAIAAAIAARRMREHARRAEAAHPPRGRFVEIGKARLHYLTRGRGSPVVLLHGNGALGEDFFASGLVDRLARRHRVFVFDRPGYGWSTLSGARAMSVEAQAALFAEAFRRLGIGRPVVVGHSWGALVAAAIGVLEPQAAGGLVLLAGYFYPVVPLDATIVALSAAPGIGALAHATVSPALIRAVWPRLTRRLFAPAPVPPRFRRMPVELVLRPSHLATAAAELPGTLISVSRLAPRYGEIRLPVAILAGPGDREVPTERHSRRLARDIPGATLTLVPKAGHMIHYSALGEIVSAVEAVAARAGDERGQPPFPLRSLAADSKIAADGANLQPASAGSGHGDLPA